MNTTLVGARSPLRAIQSGRGDGTGRSHHCWVGVLLGVLSLAVANAGALASSPASDSSETNFFSAHPVCRIQIEVSPQNIQRLRTNGREYIPATIRAGGEVICEVGLHLKGSTGSFRSIDDKPAFTLDFGQLIPGQRFHGLQKIHLNNSVEDPSYLKEQLGSELFRAAGIPVPRVTHALVELNRRKLGLYVLKEGFTGDFIARHFARADGSLYDTDEGHDVNLHMKRHLGPASDNEQLPLQRLAAASLEPDLNRRWERLHESVDLERFLTFMAMEIMICHWDGYCLGRNNFRIYHDPTTDKAVFLPSGMDQIFSKADLQWKPDMAGLVARAIMEIPDGREQYAVRFRALFTTRFASDQITNRVHQMLSDLRPALRAREFEKIRREAAEICVQIGRREVYVRKRLSEPEPAVPLFENGIARLTDWKAGANTGEGKIAEAQSPDGRIALHIVAGSRTSHAWKTTVRLKQGRYRFEGKAKVAGVTGLPFGMNHGASLRIEGTPQRSASLTGTSDWKLLAADFEVSAIEEEIVLICELRASSGAAWFEKDSLKIIRLN